MMRSPAPGAPRGRPAEIFVGRRGEVEEIAAALADADGGQPRIVLVEGDAGMGKTSLLARALDGCRERPGGATVLRGGGDEAESELAYGLLDQLVAEVDADVLDRFPLARPARDPRVDPMAVGADLLGVLGALSVDRPAVVVIDDAQWADDLSVRAVVFALRRLRHDRVLVVLGVRGAGAGAPPDERGPGVDPRWERALASVGGARRLTLRGLDPTELSELAVALGSPLGSTGAAERLWRHTQGHPLHARTLVEELPPEVLAGTSGVLPAPRSLATVVLVRLSRATPDAQALTVAAAVLGETCPLARAAALAGLDDPGAALDDAVRVGLIEERPGGPVARIGFVHPLLRAAVHGDLPPARRRALHRTAATMVGARRALLHRVAAATGPDPGLAAELEALAGDASAGAGAGETADLLRAAADLDVTPDDRERRLFEAAETLLAHGELRRASALEADLAACRPGPRRSELLGRAALLTGHFARARAQLDAAEQQAEQAEQQAGPATRVRGSVRAHRALLHLLEGAPQQAVDLAAAAFADAGQDPGIRPAAGFALILGLAAAGRGGDARAVLDLASGPPEARTPLYADALVVRGVLAALADDDAEAAGALEEAVRHARAGEPVRTLALATAFRAAVADRTGEQGGLAGLEVAVAAARDGGVAFAEAIAHGLTAQVLAVRGRDTEARAHLAAALGDGPAWWGAALSTSVAGAVVALAADDPAGMLAALEPVLRPEVLVLADGLGSFVPRVLHAEALLRGGDTVGAATALDALDGHLAERVPGRCALDAARLRALLAEAAGRPDAARVALEDGLVLAEGMRAPLAVARTETELGRLLLTVGERRAGVDALRSARDRLRGLDAVPFLARTERLLHDAGLTPAPGEEALGLTAHEEAVVALVVSGRSNREVGRELFVTPRTVAYHLSNVYAKLGVASRRELRDRLAPR